MVDAKKIEKKLPNLISKGWWSSEYDLVDYRLLQMKKKAPELYTQKRNNVIHSVEEFESSLNNWWTESHNHNGKRNGRH